METLLCLTFPLSWLPSSVQSYQHCQDVLGFMWMSCPEPLTMSPQGQISPCKNNNNNNNNNVLAAEMNE